MGDPSRHSNYSGFYSWKVNPDDDTEWIWAPREGEQTFKHSCKTARRTSTWTSLVSSFVRAVAYVESVNIPYRLY